MNFKNIKLLLILLLLAINIYLIYNIVLSNTSTQIDHNTISSICNVLSKNGISIDATLIPTEYPYADIIESDFSSSYYENVAAAVTLSERESINIMPDNSLRLTMQNGDTITLNRRFGIDYVANNFESTDMNPKQLIKKAEYTQTDLTGKEKKLLESFVFPMAISADNTAFSYKTVNVKSNGETKIAEVIELINDIYIREHTLYIEYIGEKIVRAQGVWFFPGESRNYSSELYDQLSVLFAEIDRKNTLYDSDDDLGSINSSYTITDIDFNYCIYWNPEQNGLFFIPAWKISTNQNKVRYYNAVNCELYE